MDQITIAELIELDAAVEAHRKSGAPLRAQLWQRMNDFCNFCAAQGIDELRTVDGVKVKPALRSRVIIKGGAKESPERQAVLAALEALGHGDKIVTYRDIRADALDKVWQSVPAETIQSMIAAGLIRVEDAPEVRVGRGKLGKKLSGDENQDED